MKRSGRHFTDTGRFRKQFMYTRSKEEEEVDVQTRSYEESQKRFLHYMEFRGMNEQWIETAPGEIRIMIDALADYHDIVRSKVSGMAEGYAKAAWEDQLARIKKIQTKLEDSTGYSRDKQLEICMKKRAAKSNDIGEDALMLLFKRGENAKKNNDAVEENGSLAQQEGEDGGTQIEA